MDAPRPTAELSRYGRLQRVLELAGISVFFALLVLQLPVVRNVDPAMLFLAAVAAWVAADLLSGIAHWLFDSFGRHDTPIFGPAFIRPFREHHADPQAMTRHDFVETNGSSCLACIPLLAWALVLQPEWKGFFVFLSLAILVTNQCHKWAHVEGAPRPVRLLQDMRLVLRPEIHLRHHTAPFRSHYCTASGWMNPLLDAVLRARPGSFRRRAGGSGR